MNTHFFAPALAAIFLLACSAPQSGPRIVRVTPMAVAAAQGEARLAATVPAPAAVIARRAEVQRALAAPLPVIQLTGLGADAQLAQELALRDPRFTEMLRNKQTRAALRNEVFSSAPLNAGDVATPALQACRQSRCFRVEMYHYADNAASVAFVDVGARRVLDVRLLAETQPEVPPHLAKLATQIAIHSPEVAEQLGVKPGADAALMAGTKTALNGSKCERSRHLCVAPTFVQGNRALWAVVDLTDEQLVGVRWTNLGEGGANRVTEKGVQDAVVLANHCEKLTRVSRNGWEFDHVLTLTDGLAALDVKYNGRLVIKSSKLVDWHVIYSQREGFGYSDAVGCPNFSSAAVVAFDVPKIEPILRDAAEVGFALVQEFRSRGWPTPCNYSYRQRHEFYNDGRYRNVPVSLGRGCGNDGAYRPVTRIHVAGQIGMDEWDGTAWKAISSEGWRKQSATLSAEGHQFRLTRADGSGYFVMANTGRLAVGERGDNAWSYITRHHPERDEGDFAIARR